MGFGYTMRTYIGLQTLRTMDIGDEEARGRLNHNFSFLDGMTDSSRIIFNYRDSTITILRYADFDLEDGWTQQEGRVGWNDDDKTLEVGLDAGSVGQLLQEIHARTLNDTGDTIFDGRAIYISGAQGSRPTIAMGNNNSDTAYAIIGLSTQEILDDRVGYSTMLGLVRGVNTSAWPAGTVLWLDSINGGLTATRPIAPRIAVVMGVVIRSNANDGVIGVKVIAVPRLAWLSDVKAQGAQTHWDILYWNQDSLRWELNDGLFVADSIATGAIYYTDTYWDDLKAPFSTSKLGILDKPDFDYDNVGVLFPQNDTAEIVYSIMQFSHSRKNGTDINPHVHWQQMNANDVVWKMQYKWFENGTATPATWTQLTESTDAFTYTSGNLLQITAFPTIDGSGITSVSSIFQVKVWRDDNVDGGAGGGDALGFEFDLHYEKDQPASANEYSK